MGLVGSVCARARGGVGSPFRSLAPVFVAECCSNMLSYAASSRLSRLWSPSEVFSSVICSQHSSVSLSSRSLSSIEQAQSPSPIYFQNVLPWKRCDTRFCLCGARSSSALNMLVTPYTRELRDFNEPSGGPRSALATLGTLQKWTTSGH